MNLKNYLYSIFLLKPFKIKLLKFFLFNYKYLPALIIYLKYLIFFIAKIYFLISKYNPA